MKKFDCMIIGAGPGGIGTGVVLKELGIKNYVILEKGKVGETFLKWTKETKFISPSFTTNMFFMPDLNSVTPLTSPAFSFNKQHLSGEEYAKYLNIIAKYYDLNIQENTQIIKINKINDDWEVQDNKGNIYNTKYLIWAGGEWNFPKKLFENTLHTSTIKSYIELKDDEYSVIGGGESGVDFAFNLVSIGKRVTMFCKTDIDADNKGDDPSKKLSPVTVAKFDQLKSSKNFEIITKQVVKVAKESEEYKIFLSDGKKVTSKNIPFEATGFNRVPNIIEDYISINDGDLEISNFDESLKTKNLFFVGPNLHRQNVILCFIYKFRMRFAVVACEIARRIKVDKIKINKVKKHYKKYNMYLEDIHSCDINCEC
jgi:thioredoxin reductase